MNIAEVSKKFGLTADTLRYYERIGLLPAVARNKSGNRDYSSIDCERIEFIKCMREAGLSIEVLTRYMHLFLEGDSTLKEREELLIAERDRLENRLEHMQETLSRLNHKIELYEQGAFRSNNMGCECI
jgi:DNA-binding transcriptional MerR regulator